MGTHLHLHREYTMKPSEILRERIIRESIRRSNADVLEERRVSPSDDKGQEEKPRPGSYDRDSFSEND